MNRVLTVFYVVNVDWFFLSHRLQLALEMKRRGHNVFILTKDTGRAHEIKANGLNFINVDFERSGSNPFRELGIVNVLRRFYKLYKPDIVHHVTIKPAIYGSIASRVLKNVVVFNAISGLGYNFIEGRNGLVQRTIKRLMTFAFNRNVNFIFQNPDDLDMYRALGFLKGTNYRLIKGAGVDQDVFTFSEPVAKDKLQVIVTARMLLDKGILEFIAAANMLFDEWKHKARFILIGDIDEHNLSGISSKELHAAERDGYLTWKGHEKNIIPSLIESDIVCLPSYREGLPKSLIEAMAIGRPIVTTDVPGCRECVEDGYNGFLVPVKEVKPLAAAIEKLLADGMLRLEMGIASRKKMEAELSLSQVITETISFYNDSIN